MEKAILKASVLMEALPYIRKFYGKTIVVKYGGSAMVDETLKESFTQDITLMKYIGLNPVIVHGGGPQIGEVLAKMGIESKFHNGMRITDEATMDVVEMVLVGKINKEIVSFINRHGGKAVGVSGKDGGLIQAERLPPEKIKVAKRAPEIIDLGRVGRVSAINPQVIETLSQQNFIPIVAPVGVSEEGETLNINADYVAGAIAKALVAEKLVLLTDVEGVKGQEEKVISKLNDQEAEKMIKNGVVSGGMIPKVKCALEAIRSGVKTAHIIDGRVQHAVLLEIFTDEGVGTVISHS
ncbi:MAG: acetylglutamate kinase [Deltaproteobacteria bacterium RIFCSPLOWO2_02_FULL_50_16]|nr:MAG: acetylglutamate kinase [Deltaproteobacteria bacterium RIFCSPLOWO2_02_FULL_50_16]OGQ66086.1 MAG: acetylglutamate kinase [Deltaproteobacteria bacterium RIFCSPLOWO2_12_FULL_50_11]